MEVSSIRLPLSGSAIAPPPAGTRRIPVVKAAIPNLSQRRFTPHRILHVRTPTRTYAIDGMGSDLDLPPVEITWQIASGALAGVMPFIIAGIEFSKRIVAQRKCEACGGSGLVQKNGYYARCPGCGGFLPWQSWKRFFTG